MNKVFAIRDYKIILLQRNIIIIICIICLFINLILSTLLYRKNEVVHLIPPVINKELAISKVGYSKNYIDEMALYFAHLLFNVEQNYIENQHELLLNYVDSANSSMIKEQLKVERKKYKDMNLSTRFYPEKVEFVDSSSTVRVEGMLHSYLGGEMFSKTPQNIIFQFGYNYGRLFIEKIILG